MVKQFAVFHAMKGKGSGGQLGRHIDRLHQVANADEQRSYLNRYVVLNSEKQPFLLNQDEYHQYLKQDGNKSMFRAVNERIDEGYQGKTAIRKDAVRYVNLMLSGSHEQMKTLEKEGKLNDWLQENYRFVAKEFGKENVVRFAMHADELTPHIHATIVPLTPDGRLSAKEYIGNKEKLKGFQNRYAQAMQPFGLERGIEGSRVRHTTTMQYYRTQQHATEIKLPQIKQKERSTGFLGLTGKEEYYEIDKEGLDRFILAQNGMVERQKTKADLNGYKLSASERENKEQKRLLKGYKEKLGKLNEVLKGVADGKVTPEQVHEIFERAAQRQEQERQQREIRQNKGRDIGGIGH